MFPFLLKVLYVPVRMVYLALTLLYLLLYYLWQKHARPDAFSLAAYYQRAFNLLGGTFIKVGQALSLRYDLFPVEQCEALGTLLDEVKPFDAARGLRRVETELKRPLGELFQSIEATPFAAASFSQVYKATAHNGMALAVKVKRPHIDRIVFADTFFLGLFRHLLALLGIGNRLGVPVLIDEIIAILRRELDYGQEARLIQVFEEKSRAIPFYRVPQVFHALSGREVLTMEFLAGTSLRELMTRIRTGHDPDAPQPQNLPEICARVYEITLRTIFEQGYFHGDPHPGNLLVMAGGEIGYVDFGIVGMLSRDMRRKNLEYMRCLAHDQVERAAELYAEMLVPTDRADWEGLKREMMVELEVYLGNIKNPALAATAKSSVTLYQRSIQLAQQYRFRLPSHVLLYYKALFTVDNTLLDLCPQYNAREETRKFIVDHGFREYLEANRFENTLNRVVAWSRTLYQSPDILAQMQGLVSDFAESQRRPKTPLMNQVLMTLGALSSRVAYALAALLLLFRFIIKPQWQWMASLSFGETIWVALGLLLFGYLVARRTPPTFNHF